MGALILLISALLSPITGCDILAYEDGSGVLYCGDQEVRTYEHDTFPWRE